jgi:DNA-binding transcriptional ArsR family regulator
MPTDAVKIIREPNKIKLLVDPIRREILRSLGIESLTGTQLAEKLGTAKSTISHHISILRKARLIRIKRSKVNLYGILEKYYEPTALVFIEDYDGIDTRLRKRFQMIHMERLRGLIIALEFIYDSSESVNKITNYSTTLFELTEEFMKQLVDIGLEYENVKIDVEAEILWNKIYGEALREAFKKSNWKELFADFNELKIEASREFIHIKDEKITA